MSKTPEPKTVSDEKYRVAARYIDKSLTPVLQRIIDKANEQLKPLGIRLAADVKWGIDEVSPSTDNQNGSK